jgi:hypothetical protein
VAEARAPGSHGDSELESEPALAALGSAADHTDGTAAPQVFDQPARSRLIRHMDVGSAHDREGPVHRFMIMSVVRRPLL